MSLIPKSARVLANLTTAKYDFAVIIFARDDVLVKDAGSTLKARDNCVFEAGLFMSAIGRDRCFLVNSVEQRDLPSDLGGIISIPFKEPQNLSDRKACARAIGSVSAVLKDSVQRAGRLVLHERLRLLSTDEVFQLERSHSDGGDLREGQVVVCDLQPMPDPERAVQVRRNLDSGTSYLYFLGLSEEVIEKVCQSLQLVLIAGVGIEKVTDFSSRLATIRKERDRVLDDLRQICHTRRLLISFLPTPPQFCFRIHNASDPELARLYLRFRAGGFMLWAEGASALSVWRQLPIFLPNDEQERIFLWMKQFDLAHEEKRRFEISLDRGLNRYFPGMQDEVKQLCVGRDS